ncbi:cilium assembly protein DZIP1L [Anopheles ziemanni]|uniref:cilium assembly protein DZIP1L n=1 Tax=Anopheles coustani TaxID=139045 RepID=UPI00265A90DC|nr:cilium assembly protein DZIP1L [Anopheles coustani]XP_058174292.1 cilium assembly protein DZIP1L [Anopheles ziemanni]
MSYKWHHNFPKIAREAGFMIRELSIGHCIDWRFVASIDPYNIVSEQDYEKLDEFIPHISEVPIGTVLNNRILDPAIGKYFILAQFSIQYLLFCKQFLDETVVEIRNTLQGLQNENVRLEKMNKKRTEETVLLQRKIQRIENINHQQHSQQATVFSCTKCTKNFITMDLLNAHIVRKHANPRSVENSYERKPSNTDTSLINTIKLELEVKQLKERLNVAEKDLLDHRSKHHQCVGCSENKTSGHDDLKAKVLHSIGIQSNLVDDKDLNEKEAQTQTEPKIIDTAPIPLDPPIQTVHQDETISKSDLQSFIEEQKRLLECWKDAERQKFNEEIEVVKQNLLDAISAMHTTEKTQPVSVSDEVIWKERYQELEQMFENSQQKTRDTMTTFEKEYTHKMDHLESLLSKMMLPESNEKLMNNNPAQTIEPAAHKSVQLRTVTLPEIVIEGETCHSNTNCTDILGKSNILNKFISSESERTESDEELKHLESSTAPKESPPVVREPTHQASTAPSPKKQILSQFRARLKMIGIDAKSKQLSGDGLNDACEALANRRDAIKKKHKNFFITRNQLLSKVDQMARVRTNAPSSHVTKNTPEGEDKTIMGNDVKLSSIAKMPTNATRLKFSPKLELLPTKHIVQFPGTHLTSDMNIFKTNSSTPALSRPVIKLSGDDVITVHAEAQPVFGNKPPSRSPIATKRRSSISSQQVEKLLDTPIKSINTIKSASDRHALIEIEMEDNSSDISEILDTVPAQPKPIPKKRVLFNLDKKGNANGTGKDNTNVTSNSEYKTIVRRSKFEEESDWNISSFDEDK